MYSGSITRSSRSLIDESSAIRCARAPDGMRFSATQARAVLGAAPVAAAMSSELRWASSWIKAASLAKAEEDTSAIVAQLCRPNKDESRSIDAATTVVATEQRHKLPRLVKIGPPTSQATYRIFLSSGDDAADLRDRVDDLVVAAINSQLLEAQIDLRVEVDRWERTAAKLNEPGETTNDQFVRRALDSDLTLALLLRRLGDGTRGELEAALEADKEVSALWFVPRRSNPRSEVARFLDPKKERLTWDKTGKPESDESWHGIVRVLLRLVLEGLKHGPKGLHVEQR